MRFLTTCALVLVLATAAWPAGVLRVDGVALGDPADAVVRKLGLPGALEWYKDGAVALEYKQTKVILDEHRRVVWVRGKSLRDDAGIDLDPSSFGPPRDVFPDHGPMLYKWWPAQKCGVLDRSRTGRWSFILSDPVGPSDDMDIFGHRDETPQVEIDGVRLGAPRSSVERALGPPTRRGDDWWSYGSRSPTLVRYSPEGLVIALRGRVMTVDASGPGCSWHPVVLQAGRKLPGCTFDDDRTLRSSSTRGLSIHTRKRVIVDITISREGHWIFDVMKTSLR